MELVNSCIREACASTAAMQRARGTHLEQGVDLLLSRGAPHLKHTVRDGRVGQGHAHCQAVELALSLFPRKWRGGVEEDDVVTVMVPG